MKWKSTNLDELLREVAAAGELNYLSLTPVAHNGGIGFSATFSPATNCTHEYAVDADPTKAALDAIKNWKGPVHVEQHAKTAPIRPPRRAFGDSGFTPTIPKEKTNFDTREPWE